MKNQIAFMWSKLKRITWEWHGVIVTVPCVAGLLIALRFAGWLQPLEWAALDIFFQLRPLEPTDERILIVGVEESDIQNLGKYPMSDEVLASVLTKIKLQQPRVIGLDIYRDIPVKPGHEELIKVFKSTPNLIGIHKVIGDKFSPQIAPPPVLKQLGQVSANDAVIDGDGVIRRAILFPVADGKETMQSLGLAVATSYLKEQGIIPKAANKGFMQLGRTVFVPFETNDGGYVRADAGGYQMLLNFRGPAQSFPKISLTDVLENRVKPDLMRDRIVLIGAQAPSLNDAFYTPYSTGVVTTPIRTPGVEIHANIASQILSSVLDNRTLIKVWDERLEELWIILWAGIIATLGWKWQSTKNTTSFSLVFGFKMAIGVTFLTVGLVGSSYLAFLSGWWIPVVPPLLALYTCATAIAGYTYVSKLKESNATLEQTNQDLQEAQVELLNYSYSLEQQAQALQESEERQKLALEAACTGIWDWNLLTGTITVTKNFSQLFGLETDTFAGTFEAFIDCVYPKDREFFTQLVTHSIEERFDYDIEFRVLRASGLTHWMQTKGRAYYDQTGKATRVLGTITNITNYKSVEEAFNREENKWRCLIQNSSDIITILTSDLEIRYSTPSTLIFLGYATKSGEYISQNFTDFIHKDDLSLVLESLAETLRDPTKIFPIEYRHRHKNGSWRFIESVVSNLLNESVIKGIVLNSRDITEHKQTELALRDIEARIARLFEEQ